MTIQKFRDELHKKCKQGSKNYLNNNTGLNKANQNWDDLDTTRKFIKVLKRHTDLLNEL